MPFVLLFMNVLELPLYPIFPFRMKILMVIGIFATIFINQMFADTSLAFDLVIGAIEFVCLFWRLSHHFKEFGTFSVEFDPAFLAICLLIVAVQSR